MIRRGARLAVLAVVALAALTLNPSMPHAASGSCPLPNITAGPGQTLVHDGASLAFDGTYLVYTENVTVTGPGASPNAGNITYNTVYSINPTTCAKGPTYTIPASRTGGQTEPMYQVTYDPRYEFGNGDLGAILVRSRSGIPVGGLGGLDAAVYAIDPATSQSELAFGVPCQQSGDSCQSEPSLFTYDFFRDRIWISEPNRNGSGPADAFIPKLISVPAQHGVRAPIDPTPTCMSRYDVPRHEQGQADPTDTATWAVGASDTLYIQMEDDVTVRRVDSRTCADQGQFTHAKYGEAAQVENDQMVCDPITHGNGAAGTSVLWLRDKSAHLVQYFDIPGGACPFPTTVKLRQPISANANKPVDACAVLKKYSNGNPPIAGQTLSFSLGNQVVGSAVTDGTGSACVSFQAPANGGSIPLTVRFNGTGALLPASDTGRVFVVGPPVPPPQPAPPAPGGTAPRPAAPPAAPVQQLVQQVQAQQQVQGQVQSQLQPGMSMEQESQVQVTVQSLSGEKKTGTLQASRHDVSPLALVIIQLTAGLLMGMTLLYRDRILQVKERLRGATGWR